MAIIPGRNPQALIAYYLGILSLFPLLGFFIAIPAVILGIRGIMAEKKDPEIEGAGHAWVGVIMGTLCGLGNLVLLALTIFGIIASQR